MEKRKRRTKAEMGEYRMNTLNDITKKESQETLSNNTPTSSISLAEDVVLEDEGGSEGEEEKSGLPAQFIIKIGTQNYRVKAYKDYWALQRWVEYTSKETGEQVVKEFQSFKYFANLGQLANRVFDFRLKNSDVANLNELTDVARKLVIDIKKEFEVNLKCKK